MENNNQNIHYLITQYEKMKSSNSYQLFEEEDIESMIEFYESQENFVKALDLIDFALEQYPYATDFMARKIEYMIENNNLVEAKELLDRAMVFDPLASNLHLLYSDILCLEGKFTEALLLLESLLDRSELIDKPDIYLEMADVYEEMEKTIKAAECIKKALYIDPHNEEALDRMWFYVEFVGNYDESIAFHNKLINKAPYSYIAWYNLACAYLGKEMWDEALDAFEYVLAINPNYEYAYSDAANILVKYNQAEKAIEYYEKAIEVGKPSEDLYYQLGLAYEYLNEYGKARINYRKALRLDHTFHEAYHRIGITYMTQKNYTKAISAFQYAIKNNPENINYIWELAQAHHFDNNPNTSLELSLKTIQENPDNNQAWIMAAHSAYELGDNKLAIEILNLGLQHAPNAVELLVAKGAILYISGMHQEGTNFLYNVVLHHSNAKTLLTENWSKLSIHTDLWNLLFDH